jgi:2-oxoisovalerate dehydrogenase E1 component beta subunit
MVAITEMNMIQALNNALDLYFAREDNAVLLGEDVGRFGGVFRVTEGLQAKYGMERVFDTPLAEAGIVGMAIGMALGDLKPVVEIQFADFVFPAFDQIVSELAKYRYRSGGQYTPKVVIRMPYGGGIRGGHYHSQSPEAYFAHTPGLRVIVPSGPFEAKGLLLGALNCPDPVIFLEPKRIYRSIKAKVPQEYYTLPVDKANVLKNGEDLTVIGFGSVIPMITDAVLDLEAEGYSVEIIDLISISPLDMETITHSVKKTGRVLVVHEAPRSGGIAGEIIASIQEECFAYLQSPLQRLAGFDTPFPYSLEKDYMISPEKIKFYARKAMQYK